jgi:hypothetical protein
MIRQLLALAWKEWRELRWVVAFALITFIGFPLISGIQGRRYAHHFEFHASPWVLVFGGLLAVVVSASAVCRDIDGPLAHFWQSRAVATTRWMLVKFVVGLALVLACCIVPLIAEQLLAENDPKSTHQSFSLAALVMAWLPWAVAAQFGFGFAAGALTRRTGSAIMVALALSLLALFLPLILPPLHAFNMQTLLEFPAAPNAHWGAMRQVPWVPWPVPFFPRRQLPILVATVLLCAGSVALALIAVRRELRIRSEQKLMYGSIALTFLLAFASAAYQLGTNLPILQSVDLGPSHNIVGINSDGRHGIIIERFNPGRWGIRTLDLVNDQLRVGTAIDVTEWFRQAAETRAWLPEQPDCYFVLRWGALLNPAEEPEVTLDIIGLQSSFKPAVTTIRLATTENNLHQPLPYLQAVGDRLYAMWWKDDHTPQAVTIKVDDPIHPQIIPCDPYQPGFLWGNPPDTRLRLEEVPALGASVAEREKAAIETIGSNWPAGVCPPGLLAINGREYGQRLTVYRLDHFGPPPQGPFSSRTQGLRPHRVFQFQQVGQYEPTFLDDLISGWVEQVSWGKGSTVYVSGTTSGTFGSLPRTTVFDLANPAQPRVLGYFAAPEPYSITLCPLPDGRALAGGRKLYLLGPPPHRPQ